ncbi:hypothetical protein ACOME3_008151 [Neoechinorhynchus agilis]
MSLLHLPFRSHKSIQNTKQLDINRIRNAKCAREFDNAYTIPVYGYPDVDYYYRNASFHDKLHQIAIPTVYMNALDDIFSPAKILPLKSIQNCDNVAMITTDYGGHIGYAKDLSPYSGFYVCDVLEDFIGLLDNGKVPRKN